LQSIIRPARASDAIKLKAIARAAYEYVVRIGREPAPMSADYSAAIAAGHVTVLEQNSEIAGYLIGWPEADYYFIENVAVDLAHQGCGLGRMLLQEAVAQAKNLKLRAVMLYTNAAMTENLSLYVHFGFVETHRVVEDGYDRVYLRHAI
jgi:ribosomal protein S18 acetylase RimI-like enzyme